MFLEYALSDLAPDFDARVTSAKKRAEAIVNGNIQAEEDLLDALKWVIAKFYRIPMFSDYFKDRLLDELVFEAELIIQDQKPQLQRSGDITKQAAEEGLFNDIDESADEIQNAWQPVSPPSDDQWQKDMENFMKTNEFKEIKK